MNKPLEVLLDAKKSLEGKHGGSIELNVASAVDDILQYLIAKETAEEYNLLCKKIDIAQISIASNLMVERDKILSLVR